MRISDWSSYVCSSDLTTLDDLHALSIAVVRGYTNTREFDARVADRRLTVEPAIDDLTNLRKLASGRVRLAVLDAAVIGYLLVTRSEAGRGGEKGVRKRNVGGSP